MTVLPRPGAPAREAMNQAISGRVIGVFAVFAVPHNLAVTCVEHILKVGLEVVESRRSLHPARSCQPSGLRKIFIATHLVQDFGSEVLSVLRLLTTLDTKEAAIGAGLNDGAQTARPVQAEPVAGVQQDVVAVAVPGGAQAVGL